MREAIYLVSVHGKDAQFGHVLDGGDLSFKLILAQS